MIAEPPIVFAIADFQTGCEIIARIPLANPEQAERDLNRVLDSLIAQPPESTTYFQLLENVRLPISVVTEEIAKRFLSKPLPLGDLEDGLFRQVVALWRKLARAYAHCAEIAPHDEESAHHAVRVATTLHRCIHATGMAVLVHLRARRELPWGLWLDLHGYYASAEEWGVATLPVSDPLEALERSSHCVAAYVCVLLCDMAGCHGLLLRDMTLVRRWANYWAPLVSLHPAEPGEHLPQFVVDLMQDVALRPVADCLQTENLRRLDTTRLAVQLTQVRQQLRQKISPAQLALGEDCTAGQCLRLLEHLSRPWLQARAPRKFRRHATSGVARLCAGFEEMHYFISGKKFEQPENARTYSRKEFDSLFAFRFQEDPNQILYLQKEQLAYGVDAWEVVNQSANGFRIVRSISGKKMMHGQLLALCPHDGERFILAQVTWLMQERAGGLIAGIRALPGMPVATAARIVEHTDDWNAAYHRAFLLPAIASVEPEQSLVIPLGWYRAGRVVELFTDGAWRVKLLRVLDDGPDFERVSFIPC